MQRVLTFVHNKKKYISKPWRFQAARMVQDEYLKLEEGDKIDPMRLCGEAVDYLFEGTEATADILDAAVASKIRMCRVLWTWFLDDFTGKNEESLPEEQAAEVES
ncbi:MAG: hypothetical protein ACI4A5_01150 [Hominilimicola sp.]